jgi:hypothetical protein
MLVNNLEQRRLGIDSPYIPVPSTREEFTAYFRKAGFLGVQTDIQNSLLIVIGSKDSPMATPSRQSERQASEMQAIRTR